jgi:hypothetical protein
VVAPTVAPTSGPTMTPNAKNSTSFRTGLSSPLTFPDRRMREAPIKGSMTLPRVHPRLAPTPYPCARSPPSSATTIAATTHPQERVGSSSSAASVTPAAGQSPAPADTGSLSHSTSCAKNR